MNNRRLFLRDSSLLIGGLFVSAPLAALAQIQPSPGIANPSQPATTGPGGVSPNPQQPLNQRNPTPQTPPQSPYGIATDQRFFSTGYYQSGYYTGYYYR